MRLAFVLLAGICASQSALCADEQRPPVAMVQIDASRVLGEVNSFVFGQNVEAADGTGIFPSGAQAKVLMTGSGFWDPEKKAPNAVAVELAKAVGTKMLRYPGGCLAHNYDWRKSVGPLETRPQWAFGLDEFLSVCKALNAEPMITVSDYALPLEEMPAHLAQLVEYLNAPATEKHPWAMKRSKWGHPAPYNVKWFELGNESVHGNHQTVPKRKYSPEQYAHYANSAAKAMRTVDPSIKLGIVTIPGPGHDIDSEWNRTVARLVGRSADFLVVHFYTPEFREGFDLLGGEAGLMEATMAVGDQIDQLIKDYQKMTERECGRRLPVAITEFNIGSVAQQPRAIRFTYGAALECADLMRVFLKPENNVVAAHYWQFLNGFWGMVRADKNTGEAYKQMPAYALFRLWAQHFGDDLIGVNIEGPRKTFSGFPGTYPANGEAIEPGGRVLRAIDQKEIEKQIPANLRAGNPANGVRVSGEAVLKFEFDQLEKTRFLELARIPLPSEAKDKPDARLTCEARLLPGGAKAGILSLGLADGRGWNKTRSAEKTDAITLDTWQRYSCALNLFPDAPDLAVQARLETEDGPISGALEVRDLRVELVTAKRFQPYELVTGLASISKDKRTLFLILFNKSQTDPITTTISLNGFVATSGKRWEVNGPSLEATENVTETASGASVELIKSNQAKMVLPPHSMTAVEFAGK